MPIKDKEKYNSYMNDYMSRRYEKRRQAALTALGSKCVVCGTTEDLEFDHVDPNKKSFYVAKAFASMSEEKLQAELSKCQLLCKKHHLEKTLNR